MLSAKLLAKAQIFIAYKFNKYYRVVKDFRQEFRCVEEKTSKKCFTMNGQCQNKC
jgi:hypothetical protein